MPEETPIPPEPIADLIPETVAPTMISIDPSWPKIGAIARVVIVTLLLIFVFGVAERVILSLSYLFFLVVLSVFFAYLLDPLVRLIRRPFKAYSIERLMPRSLAILVAYLFVFLVVGTVVASIAPKVVEQGKEFAANLPAYGNSAREKFNDLTKRYDRLKLPEEMQDRINSTATEYGTSFGAWLTGFVAGFLISSSVYLPWLVLVPVLAFFFLKDVNLVRLAVLRMVPAGPYRMRAEMILQDVNSTLAAYTRAQIISCLLIGTICTIAFYIIGLKYALLLGILAGVFEFVPLLGPATIGLVVVLTAAFGDDPWRGLYVFIFLVVLRIGQDYIFYPRIVRGGIHLHPLIIILGVLAGEQVAGIPGVFISIPVIAVGVVIYRNILDHRGSRSLISTWIAENEDFATDIS